MHDKDDDDAEILVDENGEEVESDVEPATENDKDFEIEDNEETRMPAATDLFEIDGDDESDGFMTDDVNGDSNYPVPHNPVRNMGLDVLFGDEIRSVSDYRCASPTPLNLNFLVDDSMRGLVARDLTTDELQKGYFWMELRVDLACLWSAADIVMVDPHAQSLISEQNKTSGFHCISLSTPMKQCPDVNSRRIYEDSVQTLHGSRQCQIWESEMREVARCYHAAAFGNEIDFRGMFQIIGDLTLPQSPTPKYRISKQKVTDWIVKYFGEDEDVLRITVKKILRRLSLCDRVCPDFV